MKTEARQIPTVRHNRLQEWKVRQGRRLRIERTPLEHLDRVTPLLAVAICMSKCNCLVGDIIADSGLSVRTFFRLISKDSWDEISCGQMSRIFVACGIDIMKPKDVIRILRAMQQEDVPFKGYLTTHDGHYSPARERVLKSHFEKIRDRDAERELATMASPTPES